MEFKTACHSLLLPLKFEESALLNDLQTCVTSDWTMHFNRQDYDGDWNSIALLSATGNADDIRTYSETGFVSTPLLDTCPYFKSILNNLLCEKESVRLLRLAPGSVIHEHRDRGLCYEQGVFRLHIPLQTAVEVDFKVGDRRLEMFTGECWYANFDLPHSVHNRSDASRVHLVIDCKRNTWTDQLFLEAGYDFEEEQRVLLPDAETIHAMIAELERMDTETSRVMIADLKHKLNEPNYKH